MNDAATENGERTRATRYVPVASRKPHKVRERTGDASDRHRRPPDEARRREG